MKVLTTGQVGKICKVAPSTVSKWVDSGRLKGYRVPRSQHRRIPILYLIDFLKAEGMPLGELEDVTLGNVILITKDGVLVDKFSSAVASRPNLRVFTGGSAFDAAFHMLQVTPDVLVVDFDVGNDARLILQKVREDNRFQNLKIIRVTSSSNGTCQPSVNDSFKKPFDCALLVERVCTLVTLRKEEYTA